MGTPWQPEGIAEDLAGPLWVMNVAFANRRGTSA